MRSHTLDNNEHNKDRIKSGILSVLIWSAILLFVFIYKLKPTEEEKKPEIITTMLVNFGDNRNGDGFEEPAPQEGSQAAKADETTAEPLESKTETNTVIKTEPKAESKKADVKEKAVSGNDNRKVARKDDAKTNTKPASSPVKSKTKGGAVTSNSKTGNGDGQGKNIFGKFLSGRGDKSGNQGDGKGPGNAGDPLGGDGNGDSKIGIDRSLTDYIPGTMGRGGAQPSHKCTASGSIRISYTVDKAGNIISARRSGGISDPCVVQTSVAWVKKYVKAEKSSVSSTGTYNITF
ncbi:ferric siderophore ABC transporter substrate-binding protein [Chryseobacterium foetidum]|uniref:ferric siderophore ABC transporter substrate-binding protein n=1 Tax=Chryseobacterium foetidum TaxID=2951057 RepID=UPI0021C72E61|nr:ferric siderophore ABC transporter substrate-binding protein [Chryseobacterium foetidum]